MTTGTENMVECTLENPDDFLKVRETLTRIGVASRKDKILYQNVLTNCLKLETKGNSLEKMIRL